MPRSFASARAESNRNSHSSDIILHQKRLIGKYTPGSNTWAAPMPSAAMASMSARSVSGVYESSIQCHQACSFAESGGDPNMARNAPSEATIWQAIVIYPCSLSRTRAKAR